MHVKPPRRSLGVRLAAPSLALAVLVGCDDSSTVRTYDAPKDASAPVAQTVADTGKPAGDAHADEAPIQWKVPEGWKRMPDRQMRYATFQVSAEKPDVELTVSSLPLSGNPMLPNLNRWEGQLGLPATPEADLAKVVTKVDLPPETYADVVDLSGKDAKTGQPTRLLAARVPHDNDAWFFKLMGPVDVVAAQKANFDAFLRSVQFHAHEHHDHDGHDHAKPVAKPTGPVNLAWDKLPEGWTEDKSDKPFRVKTIKVEQGGEVADLAITKIAFEQAGGMMENVNRWRTSVGLEATQDPQAHAPKQAVVAGRDGARIDVKGPKNSVIVGMTDDPGANQLWFFKLTGPSKLIEAQGAAFDSFLRAAKFEPAAGTAAPASAAAAPSPAPSPAPAAAPGE
jgi:hypothetical protein